MASSKDPDSRDVKFEDSFQRYLKRSKKKDQVPSSFLERLKQDTPVHRSGVSDASHEPSSDRVKELFASQKQSAHHTDTPTQSGQRGDYFTSSSLEGTLLQDRYRVQKRIAKGGMAWVYRATHEVLGKPVAVKVLFPELAEEPEFHRRFVEEARVLSTLSHPNIVQVYDVFEENGLLGMVMEWVDGDNLATWLQRRQERIAFEEIHEIFAPLLDAIQIIHEHGLIHRDLKPPNILLHHQDGELLPKLADFGLAKILTKELTTRSGLQMGTPAYMSPEQIKDSRDIDHRSDIYSLGVILYEVLSGELPYEQPFHFYQVTHQPPIPLRTHVRGVPSALEKVVMRCLHKQPERRYQDAASLAKALLPLLEQHAPLTPVVRERPLPRGWRALLRPEILVSILVLCVLVGVTFQSLWPGSKEPSVTPQKRTVAVLKRAALRDNKRQRPQRPQPIPKQDAAPLVHRPPAVGTLVIRSQPEATVWWRGRRRGKTPYTLKRPVGERVRIVLKADEHRDLRVSWTFRVGRHRKMWRLRREFVSLMLRSKPLGAKIWSRGKYLGKTPLRVKGRVGTKRVFELRKDYHFARKVTLQFRAQGVSVLTPTLRKRKSAPPTGSELQNMRSLKGLGGVIKDAAGNK
ncbi:MAG: hypothetical protein CL920_07775 [Deltaproteobacteria bacterium]|nr:hypothetical protein [Deltaproteobacteria bacterium]MBU48578.1 hypothetical protein [Deltaproteobacteria bacterium]|tara:strand:- start:14303 stop:16195 length:1893 start_codon:yes stop_codon:yes gene_type:complete